jgi:hypothetical protein
MEQLHFTEAEGPWLFWTNMEEIQFRGWQLTTIALYIRKEFHIADIQINITTNTMNISKMAVTFSIHIGRVRCQIQPFSAPCLPRGFDRIPIEVNYYWVCPSQQIMFARRYPWRKKGIVTVVANLGVSHQQVRHIQTLLTDFPNAGRMSTKTSLMFCLSGDKAVKSCF